MTVTMPGGIARRAACLLCTALKIMVVKHNTVL